MKGLLLSYKALNLLDSVYTRKTPIPPIPCHDTATVSVICGAYGDSIWETKTSLLTFSEEVIYVSRIYNTYWQIMRQPVQWYRALVGKKQTYVTRQVRTEENGPDKLGSALPLLCCNTSVVQFVTGLISEPFTPTSDAGWLRQGRVFLSDSRFHP